MEKRVVDVGDLMVENFTHLVTYCNGAKWLSGWDVDYGGASIDTAYGSWFKIVDTSDGQSFTMKKEFVEQNAGTITLEYRFNMVTKMDGVSWELLSKDTIAIKIFTHEGNIYCKGLGATPICLQSYNAKTEYGVKVVADITAKAFDIFINGTLMASAVGFCNDVDSLNHILIKTDEKSIGEMYLRTIRIYTGYMVAERFLSTTPGNIPSDWFLELPEGSGSVQELKCDVSPDIYSFKIEDISDSDNIMLEKTFSCDYTKVVFEFQLMLPKRMDGIKAAIYSEGNTAMEITTSGSNLCYVGAKGDSIFIHPYNENLWYRVRIVLDTELKVADIWLNGKKKLQAVKLYNAVTCLDKVKFSTSNASKGTIWIDDILVYPYQEEPNDYVPEPEPVDTSPYMIGIQSCSLWREGNHNGWDPVRQDPRRQPLLGWYEEGKPETSDWQTKWMVEHGITYNLYCWYPPYGRTKSPIKRSLHDFDLVDGYFHSKYSDYMKYAIMWENGNSTCEGIDDFSDHFIPFWIENHFADPRYMFIDGKPVMGFYDPMNLIKQMGSEEGAKRSLELLRQACEKAGFKGVHLICEYRGTDPDVMEKYQKMGFEYSYSYTWFTGDMEVQKAKNLEQKNANKIDIISTGCMGWMPSVWGGQDVSFATPEDFEDLLIWAKDIFIPAVDENKLGHNMIMLGNWNEFGEGHFFMPANLYNFGYLDAIRKVFGKNVGEHRDVVPNDKQKARLDTLYPRGWK